MNYLRTILALAALLCGASTFAAEQQPAFLQPEVLKAALAINMTDEQKPQFQQALTNFVNGRVEGINNLMRRRNVTNLDRKIKSLTNRLLRDMDEEMSAFLSEEQMPAYQEYRAKLKSHLRGM